MSNRAIQESLSWFTSARLNMNGKNYSKCIYDLQMALEIAVKGVLLSVGVDSPKKHNVGDIIENVVAERKELFSERFRTALPEIVKSLRRLLYLRSASAYGFVKFIKPADFESIAKEMFQPTSDYISICSEEVDRINAKR